MKNIVLCGFMGCGKSSVGKAVAELLGRRFFDTDEYIEEREKMSVSDIFSGYGEEAFREKETLAVSELSEMEDVVISCGGGTVLFEKNMDIFRKNGCVVYFLDAPLSVLQVRLENDESRPLIQKDDRKKAIEELFLKRYPMYKAATDVIIDAGGSISDVAKRIIDEASRRE